MTSRVDQFIRAHDHCYPSLPEDHAARRLSSSLAMRRQMSKPYLDSNPRSLRRRGAMVGADQPRAHWVLWRGANHKAMRGLRAMENRAHAIHQGLIAA